MGLVWWDLGKFISSATRNSLAVQGLGLDTSTLGAWVQSLVGGLRSHCHHLPRVLHLECLNTDFFLLLCSYIFLFSIKYTLYHIFIYSYICVYQCSHVTCWMEKTANLWHVFQLCNYISDPDLIIRFQQPIFWSLIYICAHTHTIRALWKVDDAKF